MKRENALSVIMVAACTTCLSFNLYAGEGVEDKIAHARTAAPEAVGAGATVVIDGEVVAEGSNGWTCMPEVFPGDGAAVCIDSTWGAMMTALGAKEAFEADSFGMSYMLQGDPPGGGVSNSDPYHEDAKNADDYVETGPHLMIIVPKALLEGMTDDPAAGGPWVMWGDTDYAHIMVPVK
jgi:hypothetical protein